MCAVNLHDKPESMLHCCPEEDLNNNKKKRVKESGEKKKKKHSSLFKIMLSRFKEKAVSPSASCEKKGTPLPLS